MNQKEKYSGDKRGNMGYGDNGPARDTPRMKSHRTTHILFDETREFYEKGSFYLYKK